MKTDTEEFVIELPEDDSAGQPTVQEEPIIRDPALLQGLLDIEKKKESSRIQQKAEADAITIEEVPGGSTGNADGEPEAEKALPGKLETAPETEETLTVERPSAAQRESAHKTEKGRLALSVSVEVAGGGVFRIAQIGEMLPVTCVQEFSAAKTATVGINLYAGERPLAAQNRLIKKTRFSGIAGLSGKRPAITVSFSIQPDCSIEIEAVDEGSLHRHREVIGGSWKPSEEEINEIVRDARDHLQEDEKLWEKCRLLQRAHEGIVHIQDMRKEKETFSAEKKAGLKKAEKALRRIAGVKNVTDLSEQDEKEMEKILTLI